MVERCKTLPSKNWLLCLIKLMCPSSSMPSIDVVNNIISVNSGEFLTGSSRNGLVSDSETISSGRLSFRFNSEASLFSAFQMTARKLGCDALQFMPSAACWNVGACHIMYSYLNQLNHIHDLSCKIFLIFFFHSENSPRKTLVRKFCGRQNFSRSNLFFFCLNHSNFFYIFCMYKIQ